VKIELSLTTIFPVSLIDTSIILTSLIKVRVTKTRLGGASLPLSLSKDKVVVGILNLLL
tara:strand:- start:6 stop:182 length:177 start_codon:yes stop_codon:yes gene_type:complete